MNPVKALGNLIATIVHEIGNDRERRIREAQEQRWARLKRLS